VFICGGADVPPALIRDADATLGSTVVRAYGLTEMPIFCCGGPEDRFEVRGLTDGRIVGSSQGRLANEVDGVGELELHGPQLFLGYLNPADNGPAFTDDGWFRTGDIGVLDDEGWLTIVDRRKDIIIRNGLNISAREVELAIATHPGVAEVAVVARPSSRTGEKVVAIIRQHSGTTDLDVASIGLTIAEAGLAKFKWPEEIVRVQDFPRTPSGKIAKAELRSGLAPDARPDSL
jgi:acyl-CoA synthetase (AMP-forming)/AMP-acid ligase II